jgi:hypothetical protein
MHYLVEHKNESIRADNLEIAVHGVATNRHEDVSIGEAIESGLSVKDLNAGGPVDTGFDPNLYRSTIKRLEGDHQRLMKQGNAEKALEVKEQINGLNRILCAQTSNRLGKHRSQADPYKRQRQSISKAISTAIEALAEADATAAEHFNRRIKMGTEFRYECPSSISWQL